MNEKLRGAIISHNHPMSEIDETLEDWYTEENYHHCEVIEKAKERNIGYRRWKNE